MSGDETRRQEVEAAWRAHDAPVRRRVRAIWVFIVIGVFSCVAGVAIMAFSKSFFFWGFLLLLTGIVEFVVAQAIHDKT